MVLVNYLANQLPLGGKTPAELSALYPVQLTPAGYVFSIWLLIYLLLAGFLIYQFVADNDDRLDRVGSVFAASCVFNIAWIFAWHWERVGLSLLFMIGLLFMLGTLYQRINRGRHYPALVGWWLLNVPFSLYLGWISVATLVNATVFLYERNLYTSALGPYGWTVLGILLAAVLAGMAIRERRDLIYALVIIWALSGIGVANADDFPLVLTAWGVAVGISVYLGMHMAAGASRTSDRGSR